MYGEKKNHSMFDKSFFFITESPVSESTSPMKESILIGKKNLFVYLFGWSCPPLIQTLEVLMQYKLP